MSDEPSSAIAHTSEHVHVVWYDVIEGDITEQEWWPVWADNIMSAFGIENHDPLKPQ